MGIKKKVNDLLIVVVIIIDSIFLLRLVPAILTLWKPKQYLSFYRIYRLSTCAALFVIQVVLLLVNLLHSKVYINDSFRLTIIVQVILIVSTTILDSLFCWVVSSTCMTTIKS